MAVQKCLKISYRGVMRMIVCEATGRYQDMIKMIIKCFNLPLEYQKAILITNGKGYIFDENLLDYFTLLFPQPEITFYIRLDYSKIPLKPKFIEIKKVEIKPLQDTQRHNKRSIRDVVDGEQSNGGAANADRDIIVVPLRRQNCFIGRLPTNSHDEINADDNAVDMDYNEDEGGLGLRVFTGKINDSPNYSKRMRLSKSLSKHAPKNYLRKPKPKSASLRM